ncbi:MAG: UDP-N-acetylmuramoyl-tripeptide--D-alanyl-D-alanine ligase [Planctomycetes bacterium]|nr:UDP-N-acetylmuramoyl-tripeptide--D-alanyl-D-alanine ligase [Planctomycetota bacterium]
MSIHQVFAALQLPVPAHCSDDKLNSFQIDSRLVVAGDVFVALPGAHCDGHDFLESAVESGAKLLIVEHALAQNFSIPVIQVDDGIRALAKLARYQRSHCRAKIIGITGSVGKTTAKDFLMQMFADSQYSVYASPKSYNSEIGLPLAMLGAPRDADFVILEYGINEPGEMEYLLSVVKPDMAALVAIGAAHLEGLGCIKTIAHEKNMLLRAVPPSGAVWLDEHCHRLIPVEQRRWLSEVNLFSHSNYSYHFDNESFLVEHPLLHQLRVNCIAEHELKTAMLMAEIAISCNVDHQVIVRALSKLEKPLGRMQQVQLSAVNFIDDAYNANPVSMLAALRTLSQLPCSGKRIAVLGSMLELGEQQDELHRQIGRTLDEFSFDHVLCVGKLAAIISTSAPEHANVHCVDNCSDAAKYLLEICSANDLVLLKASRGDQLERVLGTFEKLYSNPVS